MREVAWEVSPRANLLMPESALFQMLYDAAGSIAIADQLDMTIQCIVVLQAIADTSQDGYSILRDLLEREDISREYEKATK